MNSPAVVVPFHREVADDLARPFGRRATPAEVEAVAADAWPDADAEADRIAALTDEWQAMSDRLHYERMAARQFHETADGSPYPEPVDEPLTWAGRLLLNLAVFCSATVAFLALWFVGALLWSLLWGPVP